MSLIRRAEQKDIPAILNLLSQVLMVHHIIRPDLFKPDSTKYTERQLSALIENDLRPVFVYEDDEGVVRGYTFLVIQENPGSNILTGIRTLYIDDLCVDEAYRGKGIGRKLFEQAKDYAGKIGCHNLTLNVWEGNEGALQFYRSLGMVPYKYGMETIL